MGLQINSRKHRQSLVAPPNQFDFSRKEHGEHVGPTKSTLGQIKEIDVNPHFLLGK